MFNREKSVHYHYSVGAFNRKDTNPPFQLYDYVLVQLVADNEKQAIERAKKLVGRNHYEVTEVREHDPLRDG